MSGLLAAPPWRRAPLLLGREPAVLLAVVGAAVVLGATAAVTPLFASSVGSAAMDLDTAKRCRFDLGASLERRIPAPPGRSGAGAPVVERPRVARLAATAPGLDAPVLTMVGPVATVTGERPPPGLPPRVRLLSRDGAIGHVDKLASSGRPGIWISDYTMRFSGLEVGDTATLHGAFRPETGSTPTMAVPVAGIFRNPTQQPRDPFWCSLPTLVYPRSAIDDPPPPVVLASPALFTRIAAELGEPYDRRWELPPAGPMTALQARHTAAEIERLHHQVPRVLGPGERPGGSDLAFVAARAEATAAGVAGSVTPVGVAGLAVALLLVAAAGSYWVDRRRREVRLLAAKGAGPAALGGKAVLETALPLLTGALGGWALALLAVRGAGPSARLDPAAARSALVLTVVVVLAAMTLLGTVGGLVVWKETEPPRVTPVWGKLRRGFARLPWELALLAAAGWLYRRLGAGQGMIPVGDQPPRVDAVLLGFPLVFLTGAVAVGVRVLGPLAVRLRRAGAAWPVVPLLAARRIAAGARPILLLTAAAGLAVGVGLYAGAVTGSVRATLAAKAKVFVGADAAVMVTEPGPLPPGVEGTLVRWTNKAWVGDDRVAVLGVDPATFAQVAFWEDSFADEPLSTLVGRLRATADPGSPVPAIVAGQGLPDRPQLELDQRAGAGGPTTLRLRTVGHASAFPGMRTAGPMVILNARLLDAIGGRFQHQLWARDLSPDAAFTAADAAGLRPLGTADPAEVLRVETFQVVAWTFGFLQVLGVAVGCLAAGGLLLYVTTRQHARQVSFAFARRMGLTRARHARSLLLELGLPLLLGLAGGAALAVAAGRLTYAHLDPYPDVVPGPLLRMPLAGFLAAAAAVLAAVVAATWLAQWTTERARVSEVLRSAP